MVHNPGGDWNPGWGVDLTYPTCWGSWANHRLKIGKNRI